MIMIVWRWYFGGNSLRFMLIVVDFVSGTSKDRWKAKAGPSLPHSLIWISSIL